MAVVTAGVGSGVIVVVDEAADVDVGRPSGW